MHVYSFYVLLCMLNAYYVCYWSSVRFELGKSPHMTVWLTRAVMPSINNNNKPDGLDLKQSAVVRKVINQIS